MELRNSGIKRNAWEEGGKTLELDLTGDEQRPYSYPET
jgi:hypothetical protein